VKRIDASCVLSNLRGLKTSVLCQPEVRVRACWLGGDSRHRSPFPYSRDFFRRDHFRLIFGPYETLRNVHPAPGAGQHDFGRARAVRRHRYTRLSVRELPDIDPPIISVSTTLPGQTRKSWKPR